MRTFPQRSKGILLAVVQSSDTAKRFGLRVALDSASVRAVLGKEFTSY